MFKTGLKLWSANDYYVSEAEKLYEKKWMDYIELYIVPESYKNYIKFWRKLAIPFIIHAPHFIHGLNLARMDLYEKNRELIEETKKFAEVLKSEYIIIHPGTLGQEKSTITQLKAFTDQRFLVENKPYRAIDLSVCAGTSIANIKRYMRECNVGFCLDISHAMKYAFSKKIKPYEIIKNFMKLKPKVVHLCGCDINIETDEHLHFNEGNCDLSKILKIISDVKYCSLETPKNSTTNLDDFIMDMKYLKKIQNSIK